MKFYFLNKIINLKNYLQLYIDRKVKKYNYARKLGNYFMKANF
jgi:hypothetical protein